MIDDKLNEVLRELVLWQNTGASVGEKVAYTLSAIKKIVREESEDFEKWFLVNNYNNYGSKSQHEIRMAIDAYGQLLRRKLGA